MHIVPIHIVVFLNIVLHPEKENEKCFSDFIPIVLLYNRRVLAAVLFGQNVYTFCTIIQQYESEYIIVAKSILNMGEIIHGVLYALCCVCFVYPSFIFSFYNIDWEKRVQSMALRR